MVGQAIKRNKLEYIEKVHGNSKGWITRSCIDENGYSQWHYKYAELKETDLTGENILVLCQYLGHKKSNFFIRHF